MHSASYRLLCFCIIALSLPATIQAQAKLTQSQEEFFEKNIRPAFAKYCYECHSIESGKTRGGLLVDTRDGLMLGGDSGAAIEPGNVEDSVLWGAINWADYQMPPKQKMPADVIAKFRTWIEMGAPDPRLREKLVVASKVDIEAGKQHWAYQKPKSSVRSGIDSFVSAKLQEAQLTPARAATATTLLRRLNFDLIGLPPTPDEVKAFVAAWSKDSSRAIEAKVDELLARPQFGERWGRHWLDVARYGESSGKDANFTFPHAWRYRDYVIDSFNNDTPYDRFIQEQIAGDLLPVKTDENWQKNLIATGFLAIGTKGLNERNPRTFKMDLVDEQIDTMSQAILGITVACARCHDHKFDAIPTTDYYALAGIFMSTDTFYGTASGLQNHRPTELLILPVADDTSLRRSYSPQEIQDMRDRIREFEVSMRTIRSDARRKGEQVDQRKVIGMRNQVGRLQGILDSLNSDGDPQTFAMGVQDADQPVNAHVLVRGDVEKAAQEVDRGFLQVLEDVPSAAIKSSRSGRRELADWLTTKDNPLTARVMVNRVWMHLFGEGLVGSPNNWGTTGQQPTHPELLDHLAVQFMDNDWSVKATIREIVLSNTYQRSSTFNKDSYNKDPDNNLLWRANPRQLDAEALRDSMLAASGNLDYERPLGSTIAEIGDARVGRTVSEDQVDKTDNHRSVYLPVARDRLPESLALFDFADPAVTTPVREATNVPSQALYLMNNPFVTEQARSMASHLSEQFRDTNPRVQGAFLLVYGRPATAKELQTSALFFRRFAPEAGKTTTTSTSANQPVRSGANQRPRRRPFQRRPNGAAAAPPQLTAEQQTLTMFCQGLMASAEFRILN